MSATSDDIPKVKGGGLIAEYHNQFLRPLLRRMRVRQTKEFRATPDGLVFRGSDATTTTEQVSATELFPLRIFVYNSAENGLTPAWRMWCYYGLVNGKIPSIGGDEIGYSQNDASLALTTKTSGSDVVYIQGTLTADDATLLYNATFSGFTIAAAAAIPSDTTTTRNIELGRIYWSATGRPTPVNSNSHSVWIARAGGPGADYVTWAAS